MSWLDGDATGGDAQFGGFDTEGGESFTSTSSAPGFAGRPPPRTAPDASTARENPFDVFRDRRDQALERLRNPPGFDNTAIFTWGEGLENLPIPNSDFDGFGLPGTGFTTVDNKNSKNPTDPKRDGVKQWTETKRVEKVIKVASEEDPDTYIKVKVALVSVLQTHDGVVAVKWIEPTAAPGAGASSDDEAEEA